MKWESKPRKGRFGILETKRMYSQDAVVSRRHELYSRPNADKYRLEQRQEISGLRCVYLGDVGVIEGETHKTDRLSENFDHVKNWIKGLWTLLEELPKDIIKKKKKKKKTK